MFVMSQEFHINQNSVLSHAVAHAYLWQKRKRTDAKQKLRSFQPVYCLQLFDISVKIIIDLKFSDNFLNEAKCHTLICPEESVTLCLIYYAG